MRKRHFSSPPQGAAARQRPVPCKPGLGDEGKVKAACRAQAAATVEMAVVQRNSRALKIALAKAQAADVDEAILQHPKELLARLEAAEAEALRDLKAAKGAGTDSPVAALGGLPRTGHESTVESRLVVFDFDRTISKEHMWATHRDAPLHSIEINEATFVDLEALRKFIGSAREAGHQIAIATFGRRDVANKALSFMLGDDHGISISTPADFPDPSSSNLEAPQCPEGSSYLGNKNRQLATQAVELGFSAAEMFLLDDDAHNVREAAKAGVLAKHTPSGLTKGVLVKLSKLLGMPHSPKRSGL